MGIQQKVKTLKWLNIRVNPQLSARRSKACWFHRFVTDFFAGEPMSDLYGVLAEENSDVWMPTRNNIPQGLLLLTALTENVNWPRWGQCSQVCHLHAFLESNLPSEYIVLTDVSTVKLSWRTDMSPEMGPLLADMLPVVILTAGTVVLISIRFYPSQLWMEDMGK